MRYSLIFFILSMLSGCACGAADGPNHQRDVGQATPLDMGCREGMKTIVHDGHKFIVVRTQSGFVAMIRHPDDK